MLAVRYNTNTFAFTKIKYNVNNAIEENTIKKNIINC